jgi:hypothetical protein
MPRIILNGRDTGMRFGRRDGDEVAPGDMGSLRITRGKNARVTIAVRSPGTTHEAAMTIPWTDWLKLREVGP